MTSANKKNLIISAWEKTLARRDGASALFSSSGAVLRTFADIEQAAVDFSGRMTLFEPGEVVAIRIGNSPDWPSMLLAAMRRGLVPLPVGRHIEKFERDITLETCRVAGIIELARDGTLEFQRLPAVNGVERPGCDFLKLTCGPGANPRAIRFKSAQLLADCENICDTMKITEDDLNFGAIPFSHSYGFSSLITPLICRGVPLVASEDRMPRAILANLAGTGATVFPGMPVFYQSFAEMENLPELPRLRLCISAGAPLTRAVAEKFTHKLGKKIHAFYGASECGGIGYDASDSIDYEDSQLGTPVKNVDVRLLESSLIEIRSNAVGDGYFPESDPQKLDGVRFIPSDLVEQSGRGMILAGSISDVINIAGRKLNPPEVEALLQRLPGVERAVVFGVPSLLRNEEVVACIAGPVTIADVMQHAQATLSAWQMPRDFWLVDALPPPDGNGKIDRRALAQSYLKRRKGL
jgi:acyl-CoA synthetase (AMP-forming)/AMP-acid ligase II